MGMGRAPALRSPELAADQTVTFRLRAPNATDVTLNGDWPSGRGVKMTKDDAGVWSATVGASDLRTLGLHLQRQRREPSRFGESEHPARRNALLEFSDCRWIDFRHLQNQRRSHTAT